MPNLVMKMNFKNTQNRQNTQNTQPSQNQNKNVSLISIKQSSRPPINSMFQKNANANGGGCGCGR